MVAQDRATTFCYNHNLLESNSSVAVVDARLQSQRHARLEPRSAPGNNTRLLVPRRSETVPGVVGVVETGAHELVEVARDDSGPHGLDPPFERIRDETVLGASARRRLTHF
jgi:hypothetical protein